MSEPPRKRMVRPPTGGADAPRATPERLKSAKLRTASSRAWLERQINDPFAAEARAHGYRSRAALKLVEIDDKRRLIRSGARIIDLGCAPGGWLQVALARGATHLVGIDLLSVDLLPGATLFEGDFTDPQWAGRLVQAAGGPPDLILSDMAPNTTGHRRTDHLRIMALLEAAADFAASSLAPGGTFLAKAFQGGETHTVVDRLKRRFAEVRHLKPRASRAESSELYILARGFRGA
jgi:23S rRNA (uridine2552-2'-O)-methyltransferase